MAYIRADHLQAPWRSLSESEQKMIVQYIVDGNTIEDLAELYLDSLAVGETMLLCNEVDTSYREMKADEHTDDPQQSGG